MYAATDLETLPDTSLALHFNAFTGKLEGGYLYSHRTEKRLPGLYMRPADVLAYLTEHPNVRCKPMEI